MKSQMNNSLLISAKLTLPSFEVMTKGLNLEEYCFGSSGQNTSAQSLQDYTYLHRSSISSTSSNSRICSPSQASQQTVLETEQESFNYLTHFFSSSTNLSNCLQELQYNLEVASRLQIQEGSAVAGSQPSPSSFSPSHLVGTDVLNKKHYITRDSFRSFVNEIPPDISDNLSLALSRLSSVLQNMKTLKKNYQNQAIGNLTPVRSHPFNHVPPLLPKYFNRSHSLNSATETEPKQASALSVAKVSSENSQPTSIPLNTECSSASANPNPTVERSPTESPSHSSSNSNPISSSSSDSDSDFRSAVSPPSHKTRRRKVQIKKIQKVQTTKPIKKTVRSSKKTRTVSNCSHCGIRDTPEWRRGPNGSRSLCNACGLFYSKLFKKYGSADACKIFYYRQFSSSIRDRTVPTIEEKNSIMKVPMVVNNFKNELKESQI